MGAETNRPAQHQCPRSLDQGATLFYDEGVWSLGFSLKFLIVRYCPFCGATLAADAARP